MKAPRHDARTAEPSRTAVAVHAAGPHGEAADALQASPHLVAQREAIQSAFGPAAQRQNNASTSDNRTGMPDALKSGIESLSGMDLSDVRVRTNSGLPEQLQAHAVAQGNEIHLAPGQQAHLPHEAWHVVQQRQGRVKPTLQAQGVAINDDPALEREADTMGVQALQRRPNAAAGRPIRAGAGPTDPVVQRLPDRAQAEAAHAPRADSRFLGITVLKQSTKYQTVLAALDHFHSHLAVTKVADTSAAVLAQGVEIAKQFLAVQDACLNYLQAKSAGPDAAVGEDAKAAYIRQLMGQAARERVIADTVVSRVARAPADRAGLPWRLVLQSLVFNETHMNDPVDLGNAVPARQVGGAINTLDVFNQDVGVGYFKPDKAQVANPAELPDDASPELRRAVMTEWDYTDAFGIDKAAPRFSARDVASHRIDQLLGAGVTAKAEFAVRNVAGQAVHGSVMAEAAGTRAGDLGKQGLIARNAQQRTPAQINVQDPRLQRLLSRLQLLDVLAQQGDRHEGNFFIATDANQRVQVVTGIDNDIAWGTRDSLARNGQGGASDVFFSKYPGLSRLVDKELRLRILYLRTEDLRWALTGLLSAAEITAAEARLTRLKTYLAGIQPLSADEWNAVTADQQLTAQVTKGSEKSYQGSLANEVGKGD